MTEFAPARLFEVLVRHGVRFVVVGGFAAVAHGSPLPTYDVDITPERSRANLQRLVAALAEAGARVRTEGEPAGLPFSSDADLLLGITVLNLVTRFGELDLVLQPSGDLAYDDLAQDAVRVELDGVPVDLASLQHVVASKAAAGRAKDRAALPVLRRLLERSQEQ